MKILLSMLLLTTLSIFTGCSKVSDEDLAKAREAVKNGAIIDQY